MAGQSGFRVFYRTRQQPGFHACTKATLPHAIRHLAHQGLSVRLALSCNDDICIFYQLVKSGNVEYDVYSRCQLGMEVSEEGVAQSTGSPSPGIVCHVGRGNAFFLRLVRKCPKPLVQQPDLFGVCSLLRCEDVGRSLFAI